MQNTYLQELINFIEQTKYYISKRRISESEIWSKCIKYSIKLFDNTNMLSGKLYIKYWNKAQEDIVCIFPLFESYRSIFAKTSSLTTWIKIIKV